MLQKQYNINHKKDLRAIINHIDKQYIHAIQTNYVKQNIQKKWYEIKDNVRKIQHQTQQIQILYESFLTLYLEKKEPMMKKQKFNQSKNEYQKKYIINQAKYEYCLNLPTISANSPFKVNTICKPSNNQENNVQNIAIDIDRRIEVNIYLINI